MLDPTGVAVVNDAPVVPDTAVAGSEYGTLPSKYTVSNNKQTNKQTKKEVKPVFGFHFQKFCFVYYKLIHFNLAI